MPFERSDEYMTNITIAALDKEVILDSLITIVQGKGKLKAYCSNTDTYVQFPNHLRRLNRKFIADVVKAEVKGSKMFYRAFKGSIRDSKNSDPIA